MHGCFEGCLHEPFILGMDFVGGKLEIHHFSCQLGVPQQVPGLIYVSPFQNHSILLNSNKNIIICFSPRVISKEDQFPNLAKPSSKKSFLKICPFLNNIQVTRCFGDAISPPFQTPRLSLPRVKYWFFDIKRPAHVFPVPRGFPCVWVRKKHVAEMVVFCFVHVAFSHLLL